MVYIYRYVYYIYIYLPKRRLSIDVPLFLFSPMHLEEFGPLGPVADLSVAELSAQFSDGTIRWMRWSNRCCSCGWWVEIPFFLGDIWLAIWDDTGLTNLWVFMGKHFFQWPPYFVDAICVVLQKKSESPTLGSWAPGDSGSVQCGSSLITQEFWSGTEPLTRCNIRLDRLSQWTIFFHVSFPMSPRLILINLIISDGFEEKHFRYCILFQ